MSPETASFSSPWALPWQQQRWPIPVAISIMLLALIGVSPRTASSAEGLPEAGTTLRFADELMSNDEPQRAVQEYLRTLFLAGWDSSRTSTSAIEGVARAHLAAEEYDQTVRWSQFLDARGYPPCRLGEVRLLTATAYLRMERPREAGDEIQRIGSCPADSALGDRSCYLLGISSVQLGNWAEAGGYFDRVSPTSSLAAAAAEYRTRALQGPSLPRHSRRLAGFLGIVPGLGYLYCGLGQTALATLVVTGVFGAATRQAFRSDQNALGGLLAAFGLSWYTGSIYGSVQSASRVDRYNRQRFLDGFRY